MNDDAYNATERSDVKTAEAAARAADHEDDLVLRTLMRSKSGRAWMFRVLASCHIHQTTFTGDALSGAFKEGERNIGLMLESNLLRVCPDEFVSMMRESHARNIVSDITRRRKRNDSDDGPDFANFVDYSDAGDPDGNAAGAGDAAVERDAE